MLSRLFNRQRKPQQDLQNVLEEGLRKIDQGLDQREQERTNAVNAFAEKYLDHRERAIFDKVKPGRYEFRIYPSNKRETLSALSDVEANIICRGLLRLGEESGLRSTLRQDDVWKAWQTGYSEGRATPQAKVAMSFEAILLNFIHTGFRPDRETVGPLYQFMADTPFQLYAHAIKKDYFRFQVFRDLAKAYPGTGALPPEARPALQAFLERVLTEAKLTEGDLIDLGRTQKHAKALVTLGGLKPPRLLAQHMARRAPRLGDIDPKGERLAALADFERFEAAAKALIKEMQETHGNPSWIASEEAYRARFGTWAQDRLAFGWWDVTDKRPGTFGKAMFDGWRDMPAVETLPNLTDQFRASVTLDTSHLDYVFVTNTVPDAQAFQFGGQDLEGDFLEHLATATAAKPNAKWRKTARAHIDRIGHDVVAQTFAHWLSHCRKPKVPEGDRSEAKLMIAARMAFAYPAEDSLAAPERPTPESRIQRCALQVAMRPQAWRWHGGSADYEKFPRLRHHQAELSQINVQVISGVLWACAEIDGTAPLAQIGQAARFCFERMRSRKAGNAALWTLGQIDDPEAVWYLARLRRAVTKDKAIFKQVDKALEAAGARHGYTLDDMKELSEFDWRIGTDGCRRERLGDYEVTLTIAGEKRVTLDSRPWGEADAEPKRGIIKAALTDADAKAQAKELKQAVEDIKRALPDIRRRFETAIRGQRVWSWDDFNERFLQNNLVAWLTRRIVFSVIDPSGMRHQGLFREGVWEDNTGRPLDLDLAQCRLMVWHPLETPEGEAMAWADRLAALGIRQPFAQAWRPSYVVTPPERETQTYSNRFAGHILYRPAAAAILKTRGWVPAQGAFTLALPAFGLKAVFTAEGIGPMEAYDQHEYRFGYSHATTDHVRFFAEQSPDTPLDLVAVPHLAFSEVMRDIELAIGITSIGRDAFWRDNGGDKIEDPSDRAVVDAYATQYRKSGSKELISTRHRFLAKRLPLMPLAQGFRLQDRFLEVTGSSGNTYQIHLGSAAISLAGRHICVVPKGNAFDDSVIPFEGDAILNEILSKAFLLSDDLAIRDAGIRGQIFPGS